MKLKVKHYKELTLDELHDIYRYCVSVFVVEQICPYQEVDDNDNVSCICGWITDSIGTPIQHMQYLPYGEPYINQHPFGYSERFTFTGKERDEETGYGYFGARYMDHELMTSFLSVDRYADKYPSISPYAYCAWNPIKLIDPTGDTCKFASKDDEAYIKKLLDRNSGVYSEEFAEKYNKLEESTHNYYYEGWEYKKERSESGLFTPHTSDNTSTINFTKGETPETKDHNIGASEYRNLFEETYHAWDFEKAGRKQHKQSCFTEAEAWMFSALAPKTQSFTLWDINKRQLTFMGRIKKEKNPLTVAFILKFGVPPTENSVGYRTGLYKDLPLCTESQFKLYGGFRAIP